MPAKAMRDVPVLFAHRKRRVAPIRQPRRVDLYRRHAYPRTFPRRYPDPDRLRPAALCRRTLADVAVAAAGARGARSRVPEAGTRTAAAAEALRAELGDAEKEDAAMS